MDGTDRLAALEAKVAALTAALAARDARIAELERLLEEVRRTGKRQSAPFSKNKPKDEWETPGRKKGEAHGRHGHRSAPPEPDRVADAPPARVLPALRGGGRLRALGRAVPDRASDSPPRGDEVPGSAWAVAGAAGAGCRAAIPTWGVWLHYGLGLSFGKCSQLLARLGINVTAGAIASSSASTGTDLVPTHEAVVEHVNSARVTTMDETGWRIAGMGAWLWAAATEDATVYCVAHHRDFDAATKLVGADYAGTIVRDGWVVYNGYERATHQTCLAHLLRRCHEMITDQPAWARATPRMVRDLLLEALAARELDAIGRAKAVGDIGERFDLLFEQAHPHDATRRLIKHLRHERGALFSFLTTDGVDATNFRGEQAIRPAVVNRKVWGGNRSDRGAETQSRVMTFLRTAHQQGADAIALLVDLARAPNPGVIAGLTLRSG